MARSIRWSKVAADDLQRAVEYIGADSRYHAAAFAHRVLDAVQTLRRFPGQGRVVQDAPQHDVRQILIGNYRLLYRHDDDVVEIIAFIHGARQYPPSDAT